MKVWGEFGWARGGWKTPYLCNAVPTDPCRYAVELVANDPTLLRPTALSLDTLLCGRFRVAPPCGGGGDKPYRGAVDVYSPASACLCSRWVPSPVPRAPANKKIHQVNLLFLFFFFLGNFEKTHLGLAENPGFVTVVTQKLDVFQKIIFAMERILLVNKLVWWRKYCVYILLFQPFISFQYTTQNITNVRSVSDYCNFMKISISWYDNSRSSTRRRVFILPCLLRWTMYDGTRC